MNKFVTVRIDGITQTHMTSFDANYATLCGLDGMTEEWDGGITVPTPKGAKIDCETCAWIWAVAQRYKPGDFAAGMAALGVTPET